MAGRAGSTRALCGQAATPEVRRTVPDHRPAGQLVLQATRTAANDFRLAGLADLHRLLARGRRSRGPSVLDRHDGDLIGRLVEDIHDDHPAPRAKDESVHRPSVVQGGTDQRELRQCRNRVFEPSQRVGRQAARPDHPRQVGRSRGRDDHTGQVSEILEGRPGACRCLRPSRLGSPECAWNGVEELGHVASVRVGLVECRRQQRPGDRSRVRVGAVREALKLHRTFIVEHDVHPFDRLCHFPTIHRTAQLVQPRCPPATARAQAEVRGAQSVREQSPL
jgi:hypothetical protein